MSYCNVHDFILSASALSSPCLELSRKDIHALPDPFPGCRKLECVYLEGNKLKTLPETFFACCPNLRWLDLRNNSLTVLPSSIEKLKSLRTLLLEGNQLTTLPLQLGRLQLTGLNLSRNPLQSPPKHIIEHGTKAVLKYLRELLNETAEGGERETSDSDDSDRPKRRSITPLQPIQQHYGIVTADARCRQLRAAPQPQCPVGGPLPLLKQITLHSQPEATARKPQRAPTPIIMPNQSATPLSPPDKPARSKRRQRKKQRRQRKGSLSGDGKSKARPKDLSSDEIEEINTALQNQKSEQELKAWRDKARQLQRAQHLKVRAGQKLSYPKPVDSAPFATEQSGDAETPYELSDAHMRLEAMDCERESLSQLHQKRHGSANSLRDARGSEVEQRIKRHMQELQGRRQQAGLISTPSAELLQAERNLAEAIVKRKEAQRGREYRLTAFTGDLPLGHS